MNTRSDLNISDWKLQKTLKYSEFIREEMMSPPNYVNTTAHKNLDNFVLNKVKSETEGKKKRKFITADQLFERLLGF